MIRVALPLHLAHAREGDSRGRTGRRRRRHDEFDSRRARGTLPDVVWNRARPCHARAAPKLRFFAVEEDVTHQSPRHAAARRDRVRRVALHDCRRNRRRLGRLGAMNEIDKTLESTPVVPLVQADDPAVAVATSRALCEGGLKVVEVVFRTDRALECPQCRGGGRARSHRRRGHCTLGGTGAGGDRSRRKVHRIAGTGRRRRADSQRRETADLPGHHDAVGTAARFQSRTRRRQVFSRRRLPAEFRPSKRLPASFARCDSCPPAVCPRRTSANFWRFRPCSPAAEAG